VGWVFGVIEPVNHGVVSMWGMGGRRKPASALRAECEIGVRTAAASRHANTRVLMIFLREIMIEL
jgi:hypothetical protein